MKQKYFFIIVLLSSFCFFGCDMFQRVRIVHEDYSEVKCDKEKPLFETVERKFVSGEIYVERYSSATLMFSRAIFVDSMNMLERIRFKIYCSEGGELIYDSGNLKTSDLVKKDENNYYLIIPKEKIKTKIQ